MAAPVVGNYNDMVVLQLDLTSDASGGDISGTSACQFNLKGGYIHKVEVNPDSGGTQPDDLYDCRFNSPLGVDIMQGKLQNLPDVNTVSTGSYSPSIGGSNMPSYGYGTVDVVCAAMGNSNGTTMDVFIYKE